MQTYLITLQDKVDLKYSMARCKTKDDLINLLMHIDEDKFVICNINIIDSYNDDFKDFCKNDSNLEKGESK